MSQRKVKITFNFNTKNIFVSGNKITKSTVLDNFGIERGTLSCNIQGEEYFVTTDHHHYFLNEKVDHYKLTVPISDHCKRVFQNQTLVH